MLFEHIIQINDLNNPMLLPITRTELWEGLMRRAERPQDYLIGVERVEILARGPDWLQREMQIGSLLVTDRILLEQEVQIRFETEPTDQHHGGTMTMRIEEPEPGALFVRFSYDTPLPETGQMDGEAGDAYFASYVKAAYRDTDVDMVRKIRARIESGGMN